VRPHGEGLVVDEVQKWPLVGNYAWLSRVTANWASKTQFPPVCDMEEVLPFRQRYGIGAGGGRTVLSTDILNFK
jgi:hypothetical protein